MTISLEKQTISSFDMSTFANSLYPSYSYNNPENVAFVQKLILKNANTFFDIKIKDNNIFIYGYLIPSKSDEMKCIIGYTRDIYNVIDVLNKIYDNKQILICYITCNFTSPKEERKKFIEKLFNSLKKLHNHFLREENLNGLNNAFIYAFTPLIFQNLHLMVQKNNETFSAEHSRDMKTILKKCTEHLNNYTEHVNTCAHILSQIN